MNDVINLALVLFIFAVIVVTGSALLTGGFDAEADQVLQNGLNASDVIESAPRTISVKEMNRQPRKQKPIITYGEQRPVLNEGKPDLPCEECKDPKWTLTDYRDSPMFKPGGMYSGHIGDDGNWVFDNPKAGNPFRSVIKRRR